MFPFALKLTALHIPPMDGKPNELLILEHQTLAANEDQAHCVDLEIENGDEDGLIALLRTLETQHRPAGVYSLLVMMTMSGGKDGDTPNDSGEYWSELAPKGDAYIQRLKQDEALPLLEDHITVEEDLRALLFPGEPRPDPSASTTVQLED